MGSLAVITWLSCALPSVAGFAGRCSLCMLCRVWNYCQCIWKCHHKYTVTFAEGFLRHSAVLLILHCALSILPYSKLSVDAKIHPDVCLLVMQVSNSDFSEHKCRIRVIPQTSGDACWHLGCRVQFHWLDSPLGSYNFRLIWGIWMSLGLRSSTNLCLLVLFAFITTCLLQKHLVTCGLLTALYELAAVKNGSSCKTRGETGRWLCGTGSLEKCQSRSQGCLAIGLASSIIVSVYFISK